jgi:hypothetical protein
MGKNKEIRKENYKTIIKKEEEKKQNPHPEKSLKNEYDKNENLSREPVGTKKIIENR